MSSRITLATFGSLGDIHPILALARELKSRGHEPVIATSELYRQKIENAGLVFHAVRPNLPPPTQSRELIRKVMDTHRGSEFLIRDLLLPALRDSYHDLHAIARRSDLLVSHPATPAAPLVAQVLKMKWMSVALAPASLWSVYDAPVLGPLSLLTSYPKLYNSIPLQRIVKQMAMKFSSRWINPLYTFRRELGLPGGLHPIFEGQHSPYGVLALFSRVLAAPQPDWPPGTMQCGYCFYDQLGAVPGLDTEYSGATLHPELRAFLDAGKTERDAPLVFTLGSAAVFDARDFFKQSTLAARTLRRRALLLIGDESNRPPNLPLNDAQIAAFPYAPYSEVFQRAAVIVHQGGAGTTGQVLRAGTPSLVMPYSHDQPDHAARLERLGVARQIARRKYSAAHAVAELEVLLNERSYAQRAAEVAQVVQSEDGPRTAADAIEKVLRP